MSANPFKRGDKVVRLPKHAHSPFWEAAHGNDPVGTVYEVQGTTFKSVILMGDSASWDYDRFRAAIAGQDYPAPNINGPLYPCVIAMRDGQLGGKYDYGVISPRNQEPLWLSNHAAAVTLAETIKKDLT